MEFATVQRAGAEGRRGGVEHEYWKSEVGQRFREESIPELIEGLRQYFHFYNHVRPHSTFGGKTPAEMYASISHKRAA